MTFRSLSGLIRSLVLLVFSTVVVAKPALIPAPPQIAASSYILMDATSGTVIAEKDSNKELPPASLTKLMTAYIAETEIAKGTIKRSDDVPISVKAWKTGGSKMFVKEGTKVKLSDLLQGIVVQSGNDASIAVAEYVAGGEDAFADVMNQYAKLLGMTHTHFMNATGLPKENHYSTAADLAKLAQAIITKFPKQYALYKEKYFTYNNIRQPNRNRLLWRDQSVDGLKTGHTQAAGYCLVASAKRGDMRLISVVMGTKSEDARAEESQKLLNYGFRYYETHELYQAGKALIKSRVWGGTLDSFQLGVAQNVVVTIPRGQSSQLKAKLDVDKVIKAPVKVGQTFGHLVVTLDDKVVVDKPLVAIENVDEGGFFKRIWDAIKLFFTNLFT
jgi:D-alanyl-D-alanine carboxypeptidase (penicillin-binding protein 5/6)